MQPDCLRQIEEAALNAWPAPRQMLYDGWVLRFAGGHSKRVNSVNPLYPSSLPLVDKVKTCEEFYARQRQPCLFRISDMLAAEDLIKTLQDASYTAFDPTYVLGRSLVADEQSQPEVTILEMPAEDWFRMRAQFIKVSDADLQAHRAIIKSIAPEKVLVGLFEGGQPIACGMGVLEGELLGFFSIHTASRWRRKGYARMLMAALGDWGIERGATFGYLQVEGHNKPALALYEKLGYTYCYRYVYYRKGSNAV